MARANSKIFASLLIGMSIMVFSGCGAQETGTEQQNEEKAVLVESGAVVTGDISSIATVNGKIAANLEVNIVPKMSGKVAQVNFQVGDQVRKGAVILRLETTELQAQLKQARAVLAAAQANYESAVTNLERSKVLFEQGAVSQQQLENAQTMVATGSTDSAAASVKLIETQIANAVVTAPAGGIVSARMVEVGEMAAMAPVMTIVNINPVQVEANVIEGDINKLKAGQNVDVFVTAVQAEPFTGTIDTISPAAESQSNTFPITIKIPNDGNKLKPGMFAEMKLILETKKGVLLVPKQAVTESDGKKYVYVIKDQKALQTEITTGVEDEAQIQVLSGLAEGDQIVLSGQNKLQNGSLVTSSGGI
ncbi:efflux RND transporter periplasmic adaptor subunit [Dehalobacterium formicoaceticum]|uniref:Efflux RND transporter periplasmic adaptor subunit n=1 Tax=Dehalobacterium formicoaceticum TaxID=51515 RepID=A0ABT1Y3F9_9FIRM|nr:efflux RND transporter periplasmic adaptor subunit [Dehalobacterium formicoaceticum]MCR6545407.1 efflux RND transporter periplasmic adaptor subunit [Dehalobacterium formicoaceticum]